MTIEMAQWILIAAVTVWGTVSTVRANKLQKTIAEKKEIVEQTKECTAHENHINELAENIEDIENRLDKAQIDRLDLIIDGWSEKLKGFNERIIVVEKLAQTVSEHGFDIKALKETLKEVKDTQKDIQKNIASMSKAIDSLPTNIIKLIKRD